MWAECPPPPCGLSARPLHVGGVPAPSMWTECRPLHVGSVCGLQSGVLAFMKFSIPPPTEGVTVYDETGTEVDADVFEDVAQQPNAGVFTIKFKHRSATADGVQGPDTSAIGKLPVVYNMRLDDNLHPTVCAPRRVPLAMKDKIHREA
ncbi:unnamed protein product [Gadus morhua 'NCC']